MRGVDGIPQPLADLFEVADDIPLLPAETAALESAIEAAAARVRKARQRLERRQRLRGLQALKTPKID